MRITAEGGLPPTTLGTEVPWTRGLLLVSLWVMSYT